MHGPTAFHRLKDSDFQQRSLLYGHPPKLVWLRIGNCTRPQLIQLMTIHEQEIHRLDADPFESVLVLSYLSFATFQTFRTDELPGIRRDEELEMV